MHLTNYPGKFEKDVVKEKAESFLGEKWRVVDEGETLFIQRRGLDTALILHQPRSIRREGIMMIRGVRLRFHKNRVEATLSMNHVFYLVLLAFGFALYFFLQGRGKPQTVAFIALAGGFFFMRTKDKVMEEMNKVFL